MSIKVVSVKFDKNNYSKEYDFLTDLVLAQGETVVVDTQYGLQIAYVQLVVNEVTPKATRWVVSRVDFTAHNARLAKDAKLKALKKQLDDRRKRLEDVAIYAMLAEKDPEMSVLLEQYREVLGQ